MDPESSTLDGTEFSAMSYEYENAILHRQGLGFCGFTKVLSYDMVRNRLLTTPVSKRCLDSFLLK